MSETLIIDHSSSKEEKYQQIIPQIKALIESEEDMIANMANVSAVLKEAFDWLWVGFYITRNGELVLGPFQGPLACTRIQSGKGVCGTSMKDKRTVIVEDVDKFPGHIACSSLSRSEIVVPGVYMDEVKFVLDVDSSDLSTYGLSDKKYLGDIVALLIKKEYEQ